MGELEMMYYSMELSATRPFMQLSDLALLALQTALRSYSVAVFFR